MDWATSQIFSSQVIGTAAVALVTLILYALFGRQRPFLDKDQFKSLKLIEKETLTHNTKRFRFALPGGTRLGLPVGQHISFKFIDDQGRDVMRSYTPVTGDEQSGYVDFVIKVYPGGKMSQYVDKLKINDTLLMRGPKGRFTYHCNMKKTFGMIAGGTGITPMYQIAREIVRNRKDHTEIFLLFANVTIDDILIKDEIEKLAAQHPERFHVHYTLDRAPENWTGSRGYITPEMIAAHCPGPSPDSMILFCGPPPMCKSVEAHAQQLGYSKDQYFCF